MATPVLLGVLALAACVPNAEPVRLGVVDGEVAFHWCGEPLEGLAEVKLVYEIGDDEGRRLPRVLAAEGEGAFDLPTGSSFTLADPPGELVWSSLEPIPRDVPITFFYDVRYPYESIAHTASFRLGPLDELEGWVHPGGEITAQPCDSSAR